VLTRYPDEENTWEPMALLENSSKLVQDYMDQHQGMNPVIREHAGNLQGIFREHSGNI
jgi:hypothetical protein